jgi:hypothetical protein
MRAPILASILACGLVAACTPDISSGTYLCGPDQTCPGDQACNGSDNRCVIASTAMPFACTADEEHEPDNTIAQARALPALGCVSALFSENGCLAANDDADWFELVAPVGCTALGIDVRIGYPIAYEAVAVVLADAAGTPIATDAPCATPSGNAGDDERCLVQTISPGTTYLLQVKPAGGGDCDGACKYNRYTLGVRLETP